MEGIAQGTRIFRFGLFEADVARGTLTRSGSRVKVQDQPFRVLTLLLEHPGEIVTRDELRQQLWPEGTFVDFDGNLNVILKKLRAALDDNSENPRFIETVPRRGYRFIAPVQFQELPVPIPASATAVVGSAAPQPSVTELTTTVSLPAPARTSRFLYIGTIFLVAVGLVWVAWSWHRDSHPSRVSTQLTADTQLRKSLAVLGFHNLSGKPEDAWLGTALSEMLSTELATGDKLRLISGEDVANLRQSSPWTQTDTLGQETSARIGKALNSDVLVLGSFANVGKASRGQLRVDVRLQDAKTGEILTEVAEIGNAQDLYHIVSSLGGKLRDRMGVPRLEEAEEADMISTLPSSAEAARFYALGLKRLRDYDALTAMELFRQSISADSRFPLSHLMLARAWAQLGYEQKRKDEARKAVELSGDLPHVQHMLVEADYYESLGDHAKAASTYRALLALSPDNVEYGLQLASAQRLAGNASQAAETIAQLRRLPAPASDDPRIDLVDVRASAKNDPSRLVLIRSALRKAAEQGKRMVYARARAEECINLIYSEHPNQSMPSCEDAYNIFLAAGNRLGAADMIRVRGDYEGSKGHYEQAIATYQRAIKILQDLGEHEKTGAVLNNLAINFANLGQLDRAEHYYQQAKSHFEQAGDKGNVTTTIGNIADILYLRGELSAAGKLYQQAIDLELSLDPSQPGYAMYRLADLELEEGNLKQARPHAEEAVKSLRALEGGYQYLTGAMVVLGEVLMMQGDLDGARQQYEQALAIRKKIGQTDLVAETQVSLAELSLYEQNAKIGENLLREAILEFEKENAAPDAAAAYTLLSRSLLMEGKIDDSQKAIERAAEFDQNTPDPALKLPIAVQSARIALTSSKHSSIGAARQSLLSTIVTARKLGYYRMQCDAELVLGESQLRTNPKTGRSQLEVLQKEAHDRGFDLIFREASALLSIPGNVIASSAH